MISREAKERNCFYGIPQICLYLTTSEHSGSSRTGPLAFLDTSNNLPLQIYIYFSFCTECSPSSQPRPYPQHPNIFYLNTRSSVLHSQTLTRAGWTPTSHGLRLLVPPQTLQPAPISFLLTTAKNLSDPNVLFCHPDVPLSAVPDAVHFLLVCENSPPHWVPTRAFS